MDWFFDILLWSPMLLPLTVSSIGTASRDYSTIAAWEAACPSDLTTETDTWEGECYNDSEFSSASQIVAFQGVTTDATYFETLRCASGESFTDHADKATNALRYNQSVGVGLDTTTNEQHTIEIQDDYVVLDGLQISNTRGSGGGSCVLITNAEGITIRDCLTYQTCNRSNILSYNGTTAIHTLINVLAIHDVSDNAGFETQSAAHEFYHCTAVVPTDVTWSHSVYGFRAISGSPVAKDCCCFGFGSNDWSSGWGASSDYNASDGTASPGSNSVDSLTYDDQFEDNSDASGDFRLVSGSGLIGQGVQVAASNDLDIIGQARDTSTPDIGCWEFQSSGATPKGVFNHPLFAGRGGFH